MGDEAHGVGVDGAGADAGGRERGQDLAGKTVGGRADDVRLDVIGIDASGEPLGERDRERACSGVVVAQAVDHRLQRHDPRGGDDAGLAHPTTETRSIATRLGDRVTRAAQQRSHRRRETLRQAEHHGVGTRDELGRRDVERDGRVPDARAVAVHREAVLARGIGHRVDLGDAPRAPARRHVRVLDRHRGDLGQVMMLRRRRARDRVGMRARPSPSGSGRSCTRAFPADDAFSYR